MDVLKQPKWWLKWWLHTSFFGGLAIFLLVVSSEGALVSWIMPAENAFGLLFTFSISSFFASIANIWIWKGFDKIYPIAVLIISTFVNFLALLGIALSGPI